MSDLESKVGSCSKGKMTEQEFKIYNNERKNENKS
jgi:hypothetical protein